MFFARNFENQEHPSLLWSPGTHCAQLDGVRGLAILLVTLYRLIKEIPADSGLTRVISTIAELGERGVDLFFVLSGFLITSILLNSRGEPGYFRGFYWRRCVRIFPLYYISLLVLLVFTPWITGTTLFAQAQRDQVHLWTYMTNIQMSHLGAWSFGAFDHFWSLAIEEHFYLVWPFIVFFLTNRRALQVVFLLAISSVLARMIFVIGGGNRVAADVLTLFRMEGLCLGASLAYVVRFHQDWFQRRRLWHVSLIALLLLAVIAELTGRALMTIPHTLWAVVWVLFLGIVISSPYSGWIARSLSNKSLLVLGKHSYAMYLFQNPLVFLMTPIFSISVCAGWFGGSTIAGAVTYVAVMFGAILLLAWMSWHGLEKHFLRLKDLSLFDRLYAVARPSLVRHAKR